MQSQKKQNLLGTLKERVDPKETAKKNKVSSTYLTAANKLGFTLDTVVTNDFVDKVIQLDRETRRERRKAYKIKKEQEKKICKDLQENYKEAIADLIALKKQFDMQTEENSQMHIEIQSMSNDIEKMDKAITEKDKEIKKLTATVDKYLRIIKSVKQELSREQMLNAQLKEEKEELTKKLKDEIAHYNELQSEHQELIIQNEQCLNDLNYTESQYHYYKRDYSDRTQELISVRKELEECYNKKDKLETMTIIQFIKYKWQRNN